MKILVVGAGKVGREVTAELTRLGHDLTVIDSDPAVCESGSEMYDVISAVGNGASLTVLREAGAADADLLIATTGEDEINILSCFTAKKLGTKHTIARVRNFEYTEQMQLFKNDIGLSMTVDPEFSAAAEIFGLIQFPSFLKREVFAKGRAEIVKIKLDEKSVLCSVLIRDLPKKIGVEVLICAVERDGSAFIPDGNFRLAPGDEIYVTAAARRLVKLVSALGLKDKKIRSVLIVGGSKIAHRLAMMLERVGVAVKIVEKDSERCVRLAELLEDTVIIRGDGSDRRLLSEEGIEEADAFVTLTDFDEENIFLSLYARHLGVPKVITKISKNEFSGVISEMGIQNPISPKLICAVDIVRYTTAMSGAMDVRAASIHNLVHNSVHAVEFSVCPGAPNIGVTLRDARLKSGVLIGCIIRGDNVIIPKGTDMLKIGDTVIAVMSADKNITRLGDIFESEK